MLSFQAKAGADRLTLQSQELEEGEAQSSLSATEGGTVLYAGSL